MLEWAATSSSRGSYHQELEPAFLMSPALAGGVFTTSTTWETLKLSGDQIKPTWRLHPVLRPPVCDTCPVAQVTLSPFHR